MSITFKGSAFPNDSQARFKANAKALILRLKKLGVSRVRVDFHGGGDSGDIDNPAFTMQDGTTHWEFNQLGLPDEVANQLVPIWVKSGTMTTSGAYAFADAMELVPLHKAVQTVFTGYIDAQSVDWWNNEGGQGSLELRVDDRSYEMNISVNIVTTENELWEEESL